MNFTQKKLTF